MEHRVNQAQYFVLLFLISVLLDFVFFPNISLAKSCGRVESEHVTVCKDSKICKCSPIPSGAPDGSSDDEDAEALLPEGEDYYTSGRPCLPNCSQETPDSLGLNHDGRCDVAQKLAGKPDCPVGCRESGSSVHCRDVSLQGRSGCKEGWQTIKCVPIEVEDREKRKDSLQRSGSF